MNRIILVVITLFVLNVVLNACSDSSSGKPEAIANKCSIGDSNGSEYSGIVNGKTLGSGNKFSSRIVSIYLVNGRDGSTCTGSLLPGNVVLTASHCVGEKTAIVFSTNWECTGKDSEVRVVTDKVMYPGANPNGSATANLDYDVALLKFAGSIPSGYTSFELPNSSTSISSTDQLIMAGYGRVGYSIPNENILLRITANPGTRITRSGARTLIVEQQQTGVCSGDSGGPLMVLRNGTPQLVGVASAVSNKGAEDAAACSGLSYYVSTSLIADWIRTTHAQLTR